LPDFNADSHSKIPTSSCYYILQDCLVHLGDLARYKNDIAQAESYYKLASAIVAVNGQPYNQLAIIESVKGDQLKAIFYYCKSSLVQNPFPAAVSNLQKTLNQYCTRQNFGILLRTSCSNFDDFISLFLQFHGSIYLMSNIDKLGSLQDRIMADFEVFSDELTNDQLLSMTLITIFTSYKNKPKEEEEGEECIADDENKVWNLAVEFTASLYHLLIILAQKFQIKNAEEDNKFLPSIKIFSDWILCSGSSILLENSFIRNQELYRDLASLGNELFRHAGTVTSATALPLPEDIEVRGFFPLRRIHRRLDFKHFGDNETNVTSLRAYRIISFINWICQQEPAANYIAKGESAGIARFIYLQETSCDEKKAQEESRLSEEEFDLAVKKLFDTLPSLQGKAHTTRSKSPFRETRSLFRTDSEEQGIKEVPTVSDPVASYSLFDSTWSVPFSRSQIKEPPVEDQSYPELFEKLSLSTGTTASPGPHPAAKSAEIFPKVTKEMSIGVFPSSATTTTSHPYSRQSQSKRSHPQGNQIPIHPTQQQISNPPIEQPILPPPSFYNQPPNRMHGRMESPVSQNGLNPSVFGTNAPQVSLGQHPIPFVGHIHHPPIHASQGAQYRASFPGSFVPPLFSNGTVFGAVGQSPRSQFQSNSMQMSQNHHASSTNATPPDSPNVARNMIPSGQSIWSSNYGFGHGAISPLEQLLSDQKKNQRPMHDHR